MKIDLQLVKTIDTIDSMKDIILNCLPKILLNTFNNCFDKSEPLIPKDSFKSNGENSDYSHHSVVKWGYFVDPENYQYQVSYGRKKKKRNFYEEQSNTRIKSRNKHTSSKKTGKENIVGRESEKIPVIHETKETNYKLPHVDSITHNKKSYQNLFYYADQKQS